MSSDNSAEVQMWSLDCDEGSYLVRVHCVSRWSQTRINSELVWLEALACDTTIRVQEPRHCRDGGMVVKAEVPGVRESRLVTVLRWVQPEQVDETYGKILQALTG